MAEPRSTHIETGNIPEPVTPELGGLGLTEEFATRALLKLPLFADGKAFELLQGLGVDKKGISPESTVAAVAVIRLAQEKIVKSITADSDILPEHKPASIRVNLKHLLKLEPDETPQQRFIKVLEFVLYDDK